MRIGFLNFGWKRNEILFNPINYRFLDIYFLSTYNRLIMKKYLLFRFSRYYPLGGFDDFVKDFDTIEEVVEYLKFADYKDYDQIIDRDTKQQVSL